ncbi:MAG TPA: hypothetical protein VGG02_13900 [Chthoniobacterales bacterium]|jgi:outer membrane murein-binding lipoprotein Lpp
MKKSKLLLAAAFGAGLLFVGCSTTPSSTTTTTTSTSSTAQGLNAPNPSNPINQNASMPGQGMHGGH